MLNGQPRFALTNSLESVEDQQAQRPVDTNIAFRRNFDFGSVDQDFRQADHIIRRASCASSPRSGAQPMETVGGGAEYNLGTGKFTIYANISMYNYVGWLVTASLGVPTHRLNIEPTLAGGSSAARSSYIESWSSPPV